MSRLRTVRLLALRAIRCHPLRSALAVLAVASGTTMAVSVPIVHESVTASVEQFGEALAGPGELRVVGAVRRGGLEPGVLDAVAATDGVASAVPMVQAVTLLSPDGGTVSSATGQTDGSSTLALGVDCRAGVLVDHHDCDDDRLSLPAEQPLFASPAVAGLAEQESGEPAGFLRTNRGDVPLEDVPLVDAVPSLADSRYVVFPLATAQHLFDRGESLDVIYVIPEAGHDLDRLQEELRRVVGAHNAVLDTAQGPPEVDATLADTLPLFTLLALFALGTGAMLVYNTVGLTVERRRREHATVAALGGTTRTVGAVVLVDAALIGLLGGLVGAAGGIAVASPMVASLSDYTERVAGIPLDVHLSAGLPLLAAALGTIVALLAAAPGARRAARVEVVEELSERGRQLDNSRPRRLRRAAAWAAVAAVALGAVRVAVRDGGLSAWQVPAGAVGFAVAAGAVLLTGAALGPLLARLVLRPFGRWAPGRLASAGIAGPSGRSGLMVAALAAAATTAFLSSSYGNAYSTALTGDVQNTMRGVQVSALASGANINMDAGISPATLRHLETIDGVSAAYRGTTVLAGTAEEVMLVTAQQRPWERSDGAQGVRGTLDRQRFEQGEAVISTALARSTGLRPGDDVALPTPQGMVELPVQAVVHGGSAGSGRVTVDYATHLELYGPQPVRSVYLEAEAGLEPQVLADRVRSAAGSGGPEAGLRVETPAEVVADTERVVAEQMVPFTTLQRTLLAVAFVAVLSTMLLVGVQRTRDLALLATVGASPAMLARTVLAEATAVAVVASALAVLGGLPLLWAMTALAPLTTGIPVPFQPDWWSVPVAGVMVLGVAWLAALWPARRAARVDVVPALNAG